MDARGDIKILITALHVVKCTAKIGERTFFPVAEISYLHFDVDDFVQNDREL